MSYKYHEIVVINDINNKEEILDTLSSIGTDEDFCGNNGEEFTWEEALENGFESSQEYVVDDLKNSGLTGEKLLTAFFEQWLGNDNYYKEYDTQTYMVDDKKCVCSVFAIGE